MDVESMFQRFIRFLLSSSIPPHSTPLSVVVKQYIKNQEDCLLSKAVPLVSSRLRYTATAPQLAPEASDKSWLCCCRQKSRKVRVHGIQENLTSLTFSFTWLDSEWAACECKLEVYRRMNRVSSLCSSCFCFTATSKRVRKKNFTWKHFTTC